MKTEEFQVMAAELEKLTPHQRSLLVDRLHKIEHVQAVSTLVESRVWITPLYPGCGHNHIARRGSASGLPRYRCASCKGKKHNMTRKPHKRGSKAAKHGLFAEQIPVLICRDRTGNTSDFVLEKADKEHIDAALKPLLASDAIFCTDNGAAVCNRHDSSPNQSGSGLRVVGKVRHVQNVNAYDSRLKEWMHRFHGIATHGLANYLSWRRLRPCYGSLFPRAVMFAAPGMNDLQQCLAIYANTALR